MQRDSMAALAAELERYWEAGTYGHAAVVARVLERLPNSEHAPSKPETDYAPEPDEALYTITYEGRRALRMGDALGKAR